MSQENIENNRTLYNNNIVNAILRIDFDPNFEYDIDDVAKQFFHFFDSKEQRVFQKIGFTKKGQEDIKTIQGEIIHTVLINEKKKCSLVLSPEPPSIVYEMSYYTTRSIYEELFRNLSKYFSEKYPTELTARIGMRFINLFPVKFSKDYSKYLKKPYSTIVRDITKRDKLCRTLVQQETNDDGLKVRVLYGLFNKYYPEYLVSKDLTLDIDAYTEKRSLFKYWPDTLEALNHAAYNSFEEMMNEKYLSSLKGESDVS